MVDRYKLHLIIGKLPVMKFKEKKICLPFPSLPIYTGLRRQDQNNEFIQEEEELFLFTLPRSIHRNVPWSQMRMKKIRYTERISLSPKNILQIHNYEINMYYILPNIHFKKGSTKFNKTLLSELLG